MAFNLTRYSLDATRNDYGYQCGTPTLHGVVVPFNNGTYVAVTSVSNTEVVSAAGIVTAGSQVLATSTASPPTLSYWRPNNPSLGKTHVRIGLQSTSPTAGYLAVQNLYALLPNLYIANGCQSLSKVPSPPPSSPSSPPPSPSPLSPSPTGALFGVIITDPRPLHQAVARSCIRPPQYLLIRL